MQSAEPNTEKTDRFAPQQAERVFARGALALGVLSIAGHFFGEYISARQLLYVLIALIVSQLNLRSWRAFVDAAGASVLKQTANGQPTVIAHLIELLILKVVAIALLVVLYFDGGFAAVELALISLVVYLITGALGLAVSTALSLGLPPTVSFPVASSDETEVDSESSD